MPRLKPLDPTKHVDLDRLCAVFDRTDPCKLLRQRTLQDVIRVHNGEIKPETVFSNYARRLEATKNGKLPTLLPL